MLSALRTGRLYPQEYPGTHFERLSRPRAHGLVGCLGKNPPVTRPGIDPGTFRLVAQRLNHYATPGPLEKIHFNIIIPPMLNGNRCYENMERSKYFLFEKMWNNRRKGYMKSALAVGFVGVTHTRICDMPTGSVLCLVTKYCNVTLCAATLTRQILSLKFSLPGRSNE
jgi:hypothetical protein